MLLLRFTLLEAAKIPPPKLAELPDTVLLLRVMLLSLARIPPPVFAVPPVTVKLFKLTVELVILKTRPVLFASTVKLGVVYLGQ